MKAQGSNRIRAFLVGTPLLAILALVGCASAAGSGVHGAPEVKGNVAVTKSILDAVFTAGDFQPLFDHLADDVVLQVAVLGGIPASREFRGKRAVMAFFLNEGDVTGFLQERPPEYFGSDERVVVLAREDTEPGRAGASRRVSGPAAVVDFRDGRIIRFLVVEDASAVWEAHRRGESRWDRTEARP
jgi:ketosteroid isomerase-like protein